MRIRPSHIVNKKTITFGTLLVGSAIGFQACNGDQDNKIDDVFETISQTYIEQMAKLNRPDSTPAVIDESTIELHTMLIAETFLDRLAANNLQNIYTEEQLKEVAAKQSIVIAKYLVSYGDNELTYEKFLTMETNSILAKKLADVERSVLGVTSLAKHTEVFFGNGDRSKANKLKEKITAKDIANGWVAKAPASPTLYNFTLEEFTSNYLASLGTIKALYLKKNTEQLVSFQTNIV